MSSSEWNHQRLSECVSFVDTTLTHLNLNKFQLRIPYDISFESQVNDWVRYAVSCNVQELIIFLESINYEYELDVKRLVFSRYVSPWDDLDIVEINASYVLSLTIEHTLLMWKLLLLDVSSVVEAKLDYCKGSHYETTHGEEKEEMFKGFILKLRNVKELTIGCYCQKVFTRLKAKGFIFPSNIKYLHWSGPSEEDEDEYEYEYEDVEDDSD
ncbi:hypothetical protein Tco_0660033 [Tanacetum coccineum]